MTNPIFDQDLVRQFLLLWDNGNVAVDFEEAAFAPIRSPGGEREVPRKSDVSRRYCRFLYALVTLLKPKRALEVGLANGMSAAFIAGAMKTYQPATDNAHYAIDPFQGQKWHDAGRENLRRLGLHAFVRVIDDFSYRAIPKLEADGDRFDFVFIDGNHRLDYVLTDVMTADRVMNPGGVMVLDDSNDFGVALAIPFIDRYRTSLRRIRLDGPLVHWLREHVLKRRRLTIYQKAEDNQKGDPNY